MNKRRRAGFGLYFGVFLILMVIVCSLLYGRGTTSNMTYSDVVKLFQQEQVKSFTVDDGVLGMQLADGTSKYYQLDSVDAFRADLGDLIDAQYDAGIIDSYDYPASFEMPWWLICIPILILVVVFFVLLTRMSARNQNGGAGGGSMARFGKANVRTNATEDGKKVHFSDVAGADEEKAELEEIVDFLQNPDKYRAIGAKIPKGILLVGPPGTGKTLLAKAVAGEAGVQFLSLSGSDFVEMYVGVGASRVRDLFDQAKKVAPSIIFIDEIDAVGRKRGAGLGGGHDEREQTLNQLLVEMDGFTSNEGVIVLAATNRKDILDQALLRPGRFDRQIYVGLPDLLGREAILRVHARQKLLGEDVDLHTVAGATAGFTGADLANLLNEAALLAARSSRPVITMPDLEEAMLKVVAGPEKKSHMLSQHEKKLTAIHEAGHAVAMYHLPTHDPVQRVTIVPRGGAGGMTISLPSEDRNYQSRNEMFEQLVALLGGRVAEARKLGDISTGASNDIQRASDLARSMVARYGMSDRLGAVCYDSGGEVFLGRDYEKTRLYSERVAGEIDDEVQEIMSQAYAKCDALLSEHDDQLRRVADYLLAHESMSRSQFEAAMENCEIPEADSLELFEGEKTE